MILWLSLGAHLASCCTDSVLGSSISHKTTLAYQSLKLGIKQHSRQYFNIKQLNTSYKQQLRSGLDSAHIKQSQVNIKLDDYLLLPDNSQDWACSVAGTKLFCTKCTELKVFRRPTINRIRLKHGLHYHNYYFLLMLTWAT